MLALAFTFPGGHYHATPWERHVNEGAVAWPPEPWRVVRALVATWHHKVKHIRRHSESTLSGLIEALSQSLPEYELPPASHSHTRHYMPQREPGKTSLILDAFAAVSREDALIMAWRTVELSQEQKALLDDLLAVMGYLGRAESWVEVSRFDGEFKPNCYPKNGLRRGDALCTPDRETQEEGISLLAPLSADEYAKSRNAFMADKRAARRLSRTLPERLLDALSVESSELRAVGWSQPPAARRELYERPADALRPQYLAQKATQPDGTITRYILIGKPLPRTEDAVRIGELFRRAVMGEAKRQLGEDLIPSVISGHGLPKDNRHRHAFYLPWDANRDGRIDRVILHLPDGMDSGIRKVTEGIKRLWSRDGEWRLVLEYIAAPENQEPLLAKAIEWESVTPYLHPWHAKRRFGVVEQIRRECTMREMPVPVELVPLRSVLVGKRSRQPLHFRRFREKQKFDQPDREGSFWRIRFDRPVSGPIALGFGCHFGLGLFRPLP